MRKTIPAFGIALFVPALAAAQNMGAPPPEATALVTEQKASGEVPTIAEPTHSTTAALSAGGMLTGGNTKAQALTINGMFDMRRGANGFGASLLGNYGAAGARGQDMEPTAGNLQLRARYDRYLIEKLSLFLIGTGRHDRFQGLAMRFNVDPGVKYIFWMPEKSALWGEFGYDFQFDIRNTDGRTVKDADGNPVAGAALMDKTMMDHSLRAYLGFRHAFNKEVTLSLGAEYLQSLIKTDLAGQNSRFNFDGTLAAKVYGGLAVGVGGTLRHDRNPLPGKVKTDLAVTLSLIYSFSDVKEPEAPPADPCPTPPAVPADPTAVPGAPVDLSAPQGSTGTLETDGAAQPVPNTAPPEAPEAAPEAQPQE